MMMTELIITHQPDLTPNRDMPITLAEPDLESGCVFGREETIKFLGYEFIKAA
jgi:hypothetical protein